MAKKTKKQAFTIVELVIVIAVIAILAAILIPTYSNLVKKANEATALVDAKNAITEMLANILGGNDEPADIVVMNKKAGKVYIHGYDASKGMILTYVENPEEPGSGDTFFDQAKAIRTKLITNGYLENVEITDTASWRHMDVLNGEGGTVEKLGFDRESMVVFADCIITDNFAKKSSGGDEPVHTHSWASEWSKDANYHWHECTADGCNVTNNSEKQGYAAHTWDDGVVTKPATETEKGEKTFTCTACDATKTEETPVTTHEHTMAKTEAKDATCTAAGNKEYWHCSGCGKYFSDANGKTETTPEAMTIPATGHNYSYTPNADGETHKAVCANCDDTIDSEDHSFGAGNTCTKCGYEKITIDLSKPIYLYKAGNYTATPITTTKMFNGTNVTYHTNISITKATMPDATYDSMDDLWCEAVESADLSEYVYRNTGSGWNLDITFMSKKELDNIINSTAYDENYNESENGYYRLVNGVKYYCEYWNRLGTEQAFLAPSDSLIVFNGDSVSSNNYTSNNSIKVRLIIDLNGYTWTHGAVDFYADASILDSSAGKTGKAIGGTINAKGYNNTATLNVYSGTFDGNGSNIVMTSSYKDKSTINVYGGTIQNGTIGISGSGIVNMFNGIIQNNNSSSLGKTYGAGAQVNGTFNLYGGKVQNNKSKGTNEGDCGGIYVTKDGTLNIYGGEISNNTGHSGGIYLLGTLNMYDGLINGNTFSRYGGGIKAADSAVLNISGGTISNNKPSDYENYQSGGGIYTGHSNYVTINITGGIISGNEAYNGAGMFLSDLDTDDMIKNIKVTGNTAQKAGGGIYFNYCNLAVIENTKINYNKLIASTGSECGGGGIYCGGSNVSIKGSETEIIGNKITQKDGVTISGSEYNPAISGGGIYASTRGKTVKIYAGTIKDNSVCSTRKNSIGVGVGDQICSAYATLYVGQSVVISNETAENKTANYGHLIAATGCTIYTQNRGWIVTKYNNDTNKDAMIVQTKETVNVNNTWDGN